MNAKDEEKLDEQEYARKQALLAAALDVLEHNFDGVIILASYRTEGGGDTQTMQALDGNIFVVNGLIECYHESSVAEMRTRASHQTMLGIMANQKKEREGEF